MTLEAKTQFAVYTAVSIGAIKPTHVGEEEKKPRLEAGGTVVWLKPIRLSPEQCLLPPLPIFDAIVIKSKNGTRKGLIDGSYLQRRPFDLTTFQALSNTKAELYYRVGSTHHANRYTEF